MGIILIGSVVYGVSTLYNRSHIDYKYVIETTSCVDNSKDTVTCEGDRFDNVHIDIEAVAVPTLKVGLRQVKLNVCEIKIISKDSTNND